MADAGWYPDAMNDGWLAYYDGQRWTGARRPAGLQAQQRRAEQAEAPASYDTQQYRPQEPADAPEDRTQRISRPAQQQPDVQPQQPAQPAAEHPAERQPTGPPPGSQWQPQQPAAPDPAQWQQQPGAWDQGQWQQQPGAWDQSHWHQQQVPPQQQGNWQPPTWDQPAPRKPRRKKQLIIAAAAVVIVAAGLLTWFLLPDDGPSITYNGKEISASGTVLSTAESQLAAAVKTRGGVSGEDTRCYFTKPKKQPKGHSSSDVTDALTCGPVLFLDGSTARQYVSAPLQASTKGSQVKLTTAATSFDQVQGKAVPSTVTLTRPDGKQPPSGTGGLKVPQPPAAAADLLTVAQLGTTKDPASLPSGTIMVGKTFRVQLLAAGVISHYGSGDKARSAPSGKKLIAFQLRYSMGDLGSGTGHANVAVTGQKARAVPATTTASDWDIVAVPTSGSALVVFTADGYTQTLALPDGTAGKNNIAVLPRTTDRFDVRKRTFDFQLKLSKNGVSKKFTEHASVNTSGLWFWLPKHPELHPSSPAKAYLVLGLSYTDPSDKGKVFGLDPQLLRLKLLNGQIIKARNVASGNRIEDVFEVPANITAAQVQITGSETIKGARVAVSKGYKYALRFGS